MGREGDGVKLRRRRIEHTLHSQLRKSDQKPQLTREKINVSEEMRKTIEEKVKRKRDVLYKGE